MAPAYLLYVAKAKIVLTVGLQILTAISMAHEVGDKAYRIHRAHKRRKRRAAPKSK
jgi:hypothetical protein